MKQSAFTRLSFSGQFLVFSAGILLAGMTVIGLWIQTEIEKAVMNRTAGVTALFVDSFVAQHLQEFGDSQHLSAEAAAALDRLLLKTPLGGEVVSFKVWSPDGTVLYSPNPVLIGHRFEISEDLALAIAGEVVSNVSDLSDVENEYERQFWDSLIETYSPVRQEGSGRVIAVSEFYQLPDALHADVRSARLRTWLVVGGATVIMYLLLAGIVRRVSNVMRHQRGELEDNVAHLRVTLDRNEDLQGRMRQAAARATALNERFLYRISADLHDGPAQDVALAQLRMDALAASLPATPNADSAGRILTDLDTVRAALDSALSDLRTIARGLRLPEIDELLVADTARRVIRDFERVTGNTVEFRCDELLATAPLPVKITIYRVLQEALANSYKHASGASQIVTITASGDELCLEVLDDGPGFDADAAFEDGTLGLAGMRERVETLGGRFRVSGGLQGGTEVHACLPMTGQSASHD